MERTLALLLANVVAVKVKLFKSNVPPVNINACVDVNAPANWNVLPVPLNVSAIGIDLPFVVIVHVPELPANVVTNVVVVKEPPAAGTVKLP